MNSFDRSINRLWISIFEQHFNKIKLHILTL
jgi:hypothetical protein